MELRLHCRCGKLQGTLDSTRVAARALCYCKDCQAYARFLKVQDTILDDAGGTEVAAVPPAAVRFTAGLEHLGCLSLSPRGIYRWYATCCDTPIGNTPRDPKMPYVGLVRQCLDAPADSLGAAPVRVNTESASRPMPSTPLRTALAIAKIGAMIVGNRLGGGYRDNPFFQEGGDAPLRVPRVLSREERAAVTP